MPSTTETIAKPETADAMSGRASARRAGLATLARWAFWPLLLALVALNAWWYREARPLTELRTVSGWIESGRTAEAERALRDWVKHSPNHGDARLMLARVLAARNDLAGCAEQLRAVPFWSNLKAEALFREGQTWMSVDRARDAELAFREYIADDPNHPVSKPFQAHAEVELINLTTLENRFDETRALIDSAIPRTEGTPREELLVLNLRTILERWMPKVAYKTLGRYLAADPSDLDARLGLAVAAQALGKIGEADAHLETCVKGRPNDPKVWRTWLDMLKERGDLGALRAALAKAPEEAAPAVWSYRGQTLALDGNLDAAFEAYSKAIAARPHDADLYYSYALIARRLGKLADEEQAIKRLKVMRKAREDLIDALTSFVKAREENAPPSKRVETCERLSQICRDLGWEQDSLEWSRLAVSLRPR